MKTLVAYLIGIAFLIGMHAGAYAQEEKTKSTTTSALCTAQEKVYKNIFDTVYTRNQTIDVDKVYLNAISKETAACLEADLLLWGKAVIADAQNGKFRKYRLSFDKPENATFKVPGKAKRNYKRGFDKARKDFIKTRKNKTLDEILTDENLKKYLSKANKAFEKQKNKHLRKITR